MRWTGLTENQPCSSGFPGHTTLKLLREVQTKHDREELKVQPKDFKDRIIFMSMYNDIDWNPKDNEDISKRNSSSVAEYAKDFPRGTCI